MKTPKKQEKKYWVTIDSEHIEYKELKDTHLKNIILWIKKRAKNGMTVQMGGGGSCAEDFWYEEWEIKGNEVLNRYDFEGLMKEVKRRKLTL